MVDYKLTRRGFFGVSAALAATGCAKGEKTNGGEKRPAAAQAFEFEEMSIADLGRRLRTKEYTAKYIVEKHIERVEKMDREGPELRAVLELNPDAVTIAEKLDREFQSGINRGPLHGIPIMIKDNIDTADRMSTTAGSLALKGSVALKDSQVARKLREAGAVILGKTNLSEWANYRSNKSSSGWSAIGGQTRNPYSLDHDPSGSSSGSAVAAAASYCAGAVGTETYGSIVGPSALNGTVGIKPTVGLIGRSGIIPISDSQDTAGPMARTVADAAAMLGALSGPDAEDKATLASKGNFHRDYIRFLNPAGLKGARIGIARNHFGYSELVDPLLEECVAAMKEAGAELIDPFEYPFERLWPYSGRVMQYEFKHGINRYLESRGPDAQVHSLEELIEFNELHRDEEMPYFGQNIFLEALEKGSLTDPEYLEAVNECRRRARKDGIDAAMDKFHLDAVFSPTGGPAAPIDLINGDRFIGGSSGLPAVAGYPNISVPGGFVYGLPIGVSFWGRAWSEPKLIEIAYSFEQTTKFRRPPKYLPDPDFSLGNKFYPAIVKRG
jgi:amidase